MLKTFAAMALGMMSVASTAGAQQDEPMYVIYNFSDATYSQQVGVLRPTCRMYGGGHGYYVQYTLEGQLTNFQIQEDAGACPGLTPIE